ncbi:MAG: CopG family transcriptional regulator [Candidatus Omnitrophica bacterium]|nr:CopG family transcriptional regulator [Candidatus Omnitrophota bacterium]
MKKRIHDQNMPVGRMTRIDDFLPSPNELVMPVENTVKVTISLKKSSVSFFKDAAKKNHTKYQRMIRALLDQYASRYRAA